MHRIYQLGSAANSARMGSYLAKLVALPSNPVKVDLNKQLDPKQKTIQTFNIDTKRLRKTKNENPLTREIGVTS